MAVDFSLVRDAMAFYKISLKKEFDRIYENLTVDNTTLTSLQNRISAFFVADSSIHLGNGIPIDTDSRGILARAFDAKIADIESQRINSSDFATLIADYKSSQTAIANQDDVDSDDPRD